MSWTFRFKTSYSNVTMSISFSKKNIILLQNTLISYNIIYTIDYFLIYISVYFIAQMNGITKIHFKSPVICISRHFLSEVGILQECKVSFFAEILIVFFGLVLCYGINLRRIYINRHLGWELKHHYHLQFYPTFWD